MKSTLLSILCITATLLTTAGAFAEPGKLTCSEKPYIVMIHADWCGKCRALESTWAEIERELGEQAIILKLDVTDRVAYQESQAEAARLGLSEFFMKYRSQSGTVGVLDCKTLTPVAVVTGSKDLSTYQKAVTKAAHPS